MERTDLDLWAVMLLDKIQKRIRIDRKEHQQLKKLALVEGRYPNIFVSAQIAAATGQKAKHIRNRGLDRRFYKEMIIDLIREHAPVPREEIDKLLLNRLPEALSREQKKDLIHNLLTSLRQNGVIINQGSKRFPQWVFAQ